jgi:hypothetical protein
MKKLLTGLALLACLALGPSAQGQGIIGPPNQIQCNSIATMAVGPTSSTLLVAAVTGQRVFVCGWNITNTAAAGTWTLTTGTGATCGGTPATIIPPMSVGVSQDADHATYSYYNTPLSFALCITPSVATIAAVVWYTQF